MKVLLISKWVAGATRGDFFYPGVWRDTFELALALKKEGIEIAILTPKIRPEHIARFKIEFGLQLKNKKIRHIMAPTYNAFGAEWGLIRLKLFLTELKTIRSFDPDIIQYMQFGASLLYPWVRNKPIIFYSCYLFTPYRNEQKDLQAKQFDWGISEVFPIKLYYIFWNVVYLGLARLFGAMTLSQMANRGAIFALMHKKGFDKASKIFGGKTKVIYIQKGIDFPKRMKLPMPQKAESANKIIFIGSILYGKGIFDLLEAMRLLQQKLPHVELTIVGTGPSSLVLRMQTLVEEQKLHVVFRGSYHYENKWDLYRHHALFCLPSYSDAYPSVILEAMAAGLPVVTTDVIDSPVIHNQSGLIVPTGNIKKLSEAMYRILTNTKLQQNLGQTAAKAVTQYPWEITARKFTKYYEQLLQPRVS